MASLNWSYQGNNGPDQWHKLYPIANGNHQSPINIKTKEVKKDPSLGHLKITWNLSTSKEIVNVGHSFHVNFEDKDNRSVVTGGPLTGNYRLHQFHFHWGQTDDHGSEHTVDGEKYASEVGPPNEHVQDIVKAVGSIKTKGKKAPFTNFDPSTLLPGSLDYWTYSGSLTHPPLFESVTWIIYKEPITISSEQLAQFRSLTLTNHRLPQPLKGRQVRT
ncbi:carbonic anhydrase 1-like isoform X2 [Chelonoidis abingdonii]|uniref:carbonic anhydrase 1-like isoform X2 n=1 Tax=Chelonoidis abingdonii TaxID=106734 RepID=UPI0013F27544|nr:carbonic anhydrase 1-like isoform X2 [Chelonoidis abingdonii]